MSSMIDDFLDPKFLPDKTESVSLTQTHISIVFLADEFVYKIKKPVNFGFLDFSTIKKRRYYCHQEIILNRRLSKDIYIDVLPITYDGKNHIMGIGEGKIVDYAVKMKRLPDKMLMKSLFFQRELTDEHLKKIAKVLARFHATARNSSNIDKFGEPEIFKVNTDENFTQIQKYIGTTIQQRDFATLKQWTENFYDSNSALFMSRIKDKKIRDCHGDLHMEHICLTKNLPIFDCIEFNNRFRYTDILADIAFLLMDLEYYGGNTLSKKLWDFYKEIANEHNVNSLLAFYKIYRAIVRGKVNSFQLDDACIRMEKKEEAVETSSRYFKLARSYIE
ncbi:MAG: gluconokinase [Deltaproteobacteria bacterium]|nr:gluconokinase [Deltaproteobacteria bacterium]